MFPHSTRASRVGPGRGFTLTELVATLLVVSLLAGAAIPSLAGLAGAREDVAATRVRAVLAFAHEWASASGYSTWVAFDTVTDTATVYAEDPGNPGKANRVAMPDPLTRAAMVLQLGESNVGIDSASFGGTTEVEFDQEGAPYDASGVALVADGTVGVTGGTTVRVTQGTGLVTID